MAVINLLGGLTLQPARSAFEIVDGLVAQATARTPFVLVDMHGEATSEKVAMGWHLAGRVSAVVGTHTHVQTNDARVLDGGTAYVSDLGMTGPHDSVIGVKKEIILRRFLTQLPQRSEPADADVRLEGAVLELTAPARRPRSSSSAAAPDRGKARLSGFGASVPCTRGGHRGRTAPMQRPLSQAHGQRLILYPSHS